MLAGLGAPHIPAPGPMGICANTVLDVKSTTTSKLNGFIMNPLP
jgi:hypothetical protein